MVLKTMRAGVLTAASIASLLATPALANSANADIAAPLRTAQPVTAQADKGDTEFRQLFASWRQMDRSSQTTEFARPAVATSTTIPGFGSNNLVGLNHKVSIPSRMPVDNLRMTSSFGLRWHPVLGGRRAHTGVDLANPVGTPVPRQTALWAAPTGSAAMACASIWSTAVRWKPVMAICRA
jgi:murein DD-endopeptidase MepM/ murein hydrolase activator NlpD